MFEELKEEIKKIIEVVNFCPEKFQEKCFELLLESYLKSKQKHPSTTTPSGVKTETEPPPAGLRQSDVHTKVKAFLKKYGITVEQLGRLFYTENGVIEPIYHLETTKMAEAQIQHALLEALKHAIASGEFTFDRECVRKLCVDKKCYDTANFAAHFKKNAKLFKSLEKDKPVELSEEGLKELAELVKALSP